MGYLKIIKKKKKIDNNLNLKEKLDYLIKKYNFEPKEDIKEYLVYAYSNYEELIENANKYYKNNILEKNIALDDAFFVKIARELNDAFKKNKIDYYKILFIFDFLSDKVENN